MGGVVNMTPVVRMTPASEPAIMEPAIVMEPAPASAAPASVQVREVRRARPPGDSSIVPVLLTGLALLYLAGFLLVPLIAVFVQAFEQGAAAWWHAITEPDARSAIWLTALVFACVIPLNLAFGIAAAWAIAR